MRIYYNHTYIDIALEDDAKVSFSLMDTNVIELHFKLSEWVEIPTGAYIEWQGKQYVMYEEQEFDKNGTREFVYNLKFYPEEYKLKHWKMRNPQDNRLQYTISVTPRMYIKHIVEALNKRDSGWSVGNVIEAPEQVVAFDHTYIWDSLIENAELFKTEMEIISKTINFCKIEKNKDNPLPLAFGKGNGFNPGVGRKNTSDKIPFSILFVQGGEKNIDYSTYHNRFLLLPKSATLAYDGEYFEGEDGFNAELARTYQSSADGLSIERLGLKNNDNEDSLDLTSIYPNRLETIVRVDVVDESKHWYDIVIDAPENLDYRNYQIGGETANVVFQSGMLGGKTFDIETNDNGVIVCNKEYDGDTFIGWKLQLVPAEIDGYMMPGEGGYIPTEGDTLRLFGITLPQEYICDNVNKSGASWEMFREAVKYMYDNEDKKFTFTGTLQAKWVRDNYLNVMGYLTPGSYILFRDAQFDAEGVRVRVTAVSYPLNNPYEVELTISNEVEGKTAGSALRDLEQEKVKIPAREKDIINYTQRGFRELKETTNMLSQAISNYDDGIKPLFVHTMQQIVGDESLQYEFIDALSGTANTVSSAIEYNVEQKQITMPQQYIRHRTLGISTIAPKHDYKMWTIGSYTSAVLYESDKAYYLYIKASKSEQTANLVLTEEPLSDTDADYLLLFAIVNKESEGTRSIVTLNGYTEVLPGRITTDKIVSADGRTYFDLLNNQIGGTIDFVNGLISGLILMKDNDGKITSAVSGMLGLPIGGELTGSLKDFAFAAGITNANTRQADAVVALTHRGYGSKIGIFSVEEDCVRIASQIEGEGIIILNGKKETYKPYSVKINPSYTLIASDTNLSPLSVEENPTTGDYIVSTEANLLLLEGVVEKDINHAWVYTTNDKWLTAATGTDYKNYATKRTFKIETSAIIVKKSGHYLANFENLYNGLGIDFIRKQIHVIGGNFSAIAYAKITVKPQLIIEYFDVYGANEKTEIIDLQCTDNTLELDYNKKTDIFYDIKENKGLSPKILLTSIILTDASTYSLRLRYSYMVEYFCFQQSPVQYEFLNLTTLRIGTSTGWKSSVKLNIQENYLIIGTDGIKYPT